MLTYCFDEDVDGMGTPGTETEYCDALVEAGWTEDCSDPVPDCTSNVTDCAGTCDGIAVVDCLGICDGPNYIACEVCDDDPSNDHVCDLPWANDMPNLEVIENNSLTIYLDAGDPNDLPLEIMIETSPSHGSLDCTNETLSCIYTPEVNYAGVDGFEYKVFNQTSYSEIAIVTIMIHDFNNVPIALSQNLQILEDQVMDINLAGIDEDTPEESLSFEIISQPVHGVLTADRVLANYVYTPIENYFGYDEFTFTIYDAIGEFWSNVAIVSIEILSENDAPEIVDIISTTGSFVISENTYLELSINGFDVEGDDVTLQFIDDSPANGEIVFISDFDFTYTPDPGFVGTDQLFFELVETSTDELLNSEIAIVEVTVVNVNDAPISYNLSGFVNEDNTLVSELVGADPDGEDITFEIGSDPIHGLAFIDGDMLTYIPDSNYNGSDVLTYTAYDGTMHSQPSTVSITVYPINDLPTAQAFTFTFTSDPDILSFSGIVNDVDGDPLTIEFIPQVNGVGYSAFGGTATHISGNEYMVTSGSMSPDYLVYKVKDAISESGIQVITLVNPAARENIFRGVPLAYNQSVSLTEDSATNFSLLGLDVSYPWPASGASYTITQAPVNGSITDNSSYALINPIMAEWILGYTPNMNFSGTDSLKFTLTNPGNLDGDPAGVSNEATIIFTVNGVNDQPMIMEIVNQTTPEDTPLVVPISYFDPDNTLELTYTSTNIQKLTIAPQNISEPDETGLVTGELLLTTALNYSGSITVTLTVTELEGTDLLQDTETFVLTVTTINDPPIVVTIANQTTAEEMPRTITLSATDVDTPIGDITFSAEVTSNSQLVTVTVDGNQLTMTPLLNMVGVATISVTADDGESVDNLSDPLTFNLTITNVNDQPYFTDIIAPASIYEDGGSSIIQFTANDVDPNEIVTVTVITNNPTLFPTGNITVITSGGAVPPVQYVVTLTPAANLSGSAVVIINLSDGEANLSTQVTATVIPFNDTPVLGDVGDQTVEEDGSIILTLSATDVDTDVASLVYSANTSDNVITSIIGNELTLLPVQDYFGDESIEISVSDGNSSDSETITLVITAMDDAPVITSTAPTSAIISSEYTYQVTVFDADPEDVTFTYDLSNAPEGMLVSANGLVTWTPAFGVETSGLVTLTVTDPELLTDTEDFEVVVDQIDCNGVTGGDWVIDDCEDCVDLADFNGAMDCAGECDGTAFIDDCGDCVGGNTGITACGPYSMDLHSGSNLRSFPALPESPLLLDVFQPNNCDYTGIITESQASQYFCETSMWQGNLTEINLLNSYWIKMNNPVTLEIAGLMPEAYPTYDLDAGSNFVSYPFFEQGSFFDVLSGDVLANSTGIIGEGVAAFYYNDQWVGSLTTGGFVPTMGYIFQMNAGISFSYNEPGMARSDEVYTIPSLSDVPSEFQYNQSSMQAFYFIENITNEGLPISTDDWIVAYHNGVVVGARQWLGTISDIPVMGYDGSDNTFGYLNSGEVPEFKLFNTSQHKLINLNINAPAWHNLGLFALDEVSAYIELPTQVSLLPAYPNPFNPRTTIRYQLPEQTNVSLVIVNMIGQEVTSLVNTQQQPGEYAISWDASDLASGIYFIKLVTENQTSLQKLMLIK
ncbi:MAG: tandem-95 repeat protein [Candidatus Marinimicrobia bacterium]|nr:tandem-95 repeat protein [Candidatus Neomarinimicrobiota bacterium]